MFQCITSLEWGFTAQVSSLIAMLSLIYLKSSLSELMCACWWFSCFSLGEILSICDFMLALSCFFYFLWFCEQIHFIWIRKTCVCDFFLSNFTPVNCFTCVIMAAILVFIFFPNVFTIIFYSTSYFTVGNSLAVCLNIQWVFIQLFDARLYSLFIFPPLTCYSLLTVFISCEKYW